MKSALLLASLWANISLAQQVTRIDYTLHIDTAGNGAFHVEMRIHDAPRAFTLAAAAHPEYDDKYWQYIEEMTVDRGTVTRSDSVLWRVSAPGPDVIVRYTVRPPAAPAPRASWRAFITKFGALGGGPHTFLYVLGAEHAAAHVTVDAPPTWHIATALPNTGARSFTAPSMAVLMDSPILAGELSDWRFDVRGVPHRVVYLRAPDTVTFDSMAFLSGVQRFVRATADFFGAIPYRNYLFMFEDGAYSGGLEHINSVTMGAPSAELARNPNAVLPEVSHEFFHTWNLMAMRPAEYRDVDYRVQPPVSSLWFSEGLTIFYADLLRRRAGLPANDSTRSAHLEYLIASYLAQPGNSRFSAEQVSSVAYNAPPGALGDYAPSTHLQGEVMGNMLDIIVRDATNGARSMDDVMRLMYRRFLGRPGYTGRDIQRAVSDVCKCRVADFFDSHVRSGNAIDFDRYLALIGLRSQVTWTPVRDAQGQLQPDMRLRGLALPDSQGVSLLAYNPRSIWVKAGLHTGDRLVSINGKPIRTWPEMRAALGALHIGDTALIEVMRVNGPYRASVAISGWDRPAVRIEQVPNPTAKQRRLLQAWLTY